MAGKKGANRLTRVQVFQARERAAKGEPLTKIAADYGVTPSCISRVVRGDAYARMGGPRTTRAKAADESTSP